MQAVDDCLQLMRIPLGSSTSMNYPPELQPTDAELIALPSGATISVPKCRPEFAAWTGSSTPWTYGGKAVLDLGGEALFAELVILRLLKGVGWAGAWIDSYRRRAWAGMGQEAVLPSPQSDLLATIRHRAGMSGGCFDVLAYTDDQVLFVEAKRRRRDRIRPGQRRWLQAALDKGVTKQAFLIVEWSVR